MGCRGRVRRSDLFFCGRGFEFLSRPAGRRQAGAGLRLRSGAFAPDCPFLILVAAWRRLPSDSVGRIEVARHRVRPTEGLRAFWPVALLDLCAGDGTCGVANCGRAGGRNWRWCVCK